MDLVDDPAAAGAKPSPGGEPTLGQQLRSLVRSLPTSAHRRQLTILGLGIVLVVCANTFMQLRLNAWYAPFYNSLEQRDFRGFSHQVLVFLAIAGVLLCLVVVQTWFVEVLKVRLREWLTDDLLDAWLQPGRPYQLRIAGEIGSHPDQRIQEDTRHLSELSADLAAGLLQALLLLVTFVGVLWALSANMVLWFGGKSFVVPGFMVWGALTYALLGSALTWWVGRPLIPLNTQRYAAEGEFRFAVVRVAELAEEIGFAHGEADERRTLGRVIAPVIALMMALANRLATVTWISSGYGWLAIIVPFIVAAPAYFGGSLSFGGLMMAVQAFSQVQQSLRWFVDNFAKLADWRATLMRVVALRDALHLPFLLEGEAPAIRQIDHPEGQLAFDKLDLLLPDGHAAFEEENVEFRSGQRIAIVGDAGAGKTTLLRAIAGLWPWGTGTILMPPADSIAFLPRRPYLPLGTVRTALAYPLPPGAFTDAALANVLKRVELDHLVPLLDRPESLDRDLPLEDQQRLAFARLLLHRPTWIFIDDGMSALQPETCRTMLSLLDRELASAAVILLTRDAILDGFELTPLRLCHRTPDGLLVCPVPRIGRHRDQARSAGRRVAAVAVGASEFLGD